MLFRNIDLVEISTKVVAVVELFIVVHEVSLSNNNVGFCVVRVLSVRSRESSTTKRRVRLVVAVTSSRISFLHFLGPVVVVLILLIAHSFRVARQPSDDFVLLELSFAFLTLVSSWTVQLGALVALLCLFKHFLSLLN